MLKNFSQTSSNMPDYMTAFCRSLNKTRTRFNTTNETVLFSCRSFIYRWSSSTAICRGVRQQCDHGMQVPCERLVKPRTPDCCLGAKKAGPAKTQRGVHTPQREGNPFVPASRLHRKSSTSAQRTETGTSYPSDHQCEDHRCGIIPLSHWLPGRGLQVHYFGSKRLVAELSISVYIYSLRCFYKFLEACINWLTGRNLLLILSPRPCAQPRLNQSSCLSAGYSLIQRPAELP